MVQINNRTGLCCGFTNGKNSVLSKEKIHLYYINKAITNQNKITDEEDIINDTI